MPFEPYRGSHFPQDHPHRGLHCMLRNGFATCNVSEDYDMSKHPVRSDFNVAHYRFARTLPHGTLPTRHFSFRDHGRSRTRWRNLRANLSVCSLGVSYVAWCALIYLD
jgi:hypothetical protein